MQKDYQANFEKVKGDIEKQRELGLLHLRGFNLWHEELVVIYNNLSEATESSQMPLQLKEKGHVMEALHILRDSA